MTFQQQNAVHFEELKKSQEEFQKRQQQTFDNLERRLKTLEETVGLRKTGEKDKRPRLLTKEQSVS